MGSSKERSAAGIQGATPAPLKAKKDVGGMTRKLPVPPPTQRRSPLIIYVKSPKTIHTKARDFMSLVQRLTGKSPPPPPSPSWPTPTPTSRRRPSSSIAPIAAMPQSPSSVAPIAAVPQSPSSACFAPLALDGASTNLGNSQEMPLNVVVDSKPYEMLPPITVPSTPQILQFSSSRMPCPNLLEISSPMVFSAPNSQEMNIPLVSAVPLCASMPLSNPTSASSSFDMDFASRADLYSI